MSKIIGIDLGTTNSCVAVMEGGTPVVLTNSEGKKTTPSVVGFTNGEKKVGELAKRKSVANPKNTVHSIKRFMGESFSNVSNDITRVQYSVVSGDNNTPRVDIDGKLYTPQEISALVLQKMKKTAEDYLGESVTEAVITVPAYFNDAQRQATKEAGEIAGLNVKRIINEPTAAALAYGLDKTDSDKNIVVFDFGGGTHDVSILQLGDGVFEVLSTAGDTHLGGDDVDHAIVNWIVSEFKKNEGVDLTTDPMAMQRIRNAAENAKIELSSSTQTEINEPYITNENGNLKHLNMTITRAIFEKLIDDIVNKTITPCKDALKQAKLKVTDIDEIILVGGSTRIPAIQNAVEKFFGKKPNHSVNPDEAVAVGAAIQGAILSGEKGVGEILLLDVIPLSLGIETMGGVMTKLVEANTTIPSKKSQIFTTAADNQPSVEIVIYQGERPMAQQNKCLGRFHLDGILPAPKGTPQIEVTFDIDANGILNVSAVDKATGKDAKIRIESNSGLTDAEIERMKKEAEENAEADKAEADRVNTINAADSALFQSNKNLEEYKDKFTSEQVSAIENAQTALKDAVERKDIESIKTCTEILNKSWQDASAAMYSQSQQAQSGQDFGQQFGDMFNGAKS